MTVLPIAYWGSIEYFAGMVQSRDKCIIDIHEHYVKRSLRNRTYIMTANGVMPISVCLQRANRPCTPVCDIRIDYSKRWQHQHWVAIKSAYKSSPYFDMIADHIAGFYENKWNFLIDYNLEIISEIFRIIGAKPEFAISDSYIPPSDEHIDMRPKTFDTQFQAPHYFQLFSDRMPFAPNLSVMDMLMCEGPGIIDVLNSCRL